MSPTVPQLPLSELAARLFAAAVAADGSLRSFWDRHRVDTAEVSSPSDRAVLGGVAADRVAWAFLSGYQAALCALVPARDPAQLAALCVTESGGAHPRAVLAELRPAPSGGYSLSGHKLWSTTVPDVERLFVVARDGLDAEGRPRLRVAALDAMRAGVRFAPMPPPPFAPEIPHGQVYMDDVSVAEGELLPGDGYADYVKPFRTIEDLHVNLALLGYLFGAAHRHAAPRGLTERLLAAIVCARALALDEPSAAATHLALAGLLGSVRAPLDELVAHLQGQSSPDAVAEHARLVRDLALLGVAGKAREQRRSNAWTALETDPPADPPVAGAPRTSPRP